MNLFQDTFTKYWCYVKTKDGTVTGVWNFVNGIQIGGCDIITSCTINNYIPSFDNVVYTTDVDQNILGNKSFQSPLVVPDAVASNQAVNLGQVNSLIASSGSYINNQASSAQTASYWINGTAKFTSNVSTAINWFNIQASPVIAITADGVNSAALFLNASGTTTGTSQIYNIITGGKPNWFQGDVYMTSKVIMGTVKVAINPLSADPLTVYNITFQDSTSTSYGRFFNVSGQWWLGPTPPTTSNGYTVQIGGTLAVNGLVTLTGLSTGTPVTNRYLALDASNNIILAPSP